MTKKHTCVSKDVVNIVYEVHDKIDDTFGSQVSDGLTAFNDSIVGSSPLVDLMVAAYAENKSLLGGIKGHTHRGWLYVGWLWVNEKSRKFGIGSHLMKLAEEEAKSRGCHASYLNTYSFQALEFYKKHGYEVFGELNDFPKGHKRLFLTKNLNCDAI